MIKRSFLKCGISNSLDGAKDDIIYEREDDTEQNGDNDNNYGYTDDAIASEEFLDETFSQMRKKYSKDFDIFIRFISIY